MGHTPRRPDGSQGPLRRGRAPRPRLPALVGEHPRRHTGRTLRGLCQDMHDHLRSSGLVELLETVFRQLPEPVAPPLVCATSS
ncbi:hypothetical protein ABZT02_29885 [Streptomyces sp. NPDC005402]|uniref:Orn/Lys/Arg family decarboxylase n=1 Tax=Streptomyces sp. NPDC005402 TaxID=3155338 RepID=UPI0033ACBC86